MYLMTKLHVLNRPPSPAVKKRLLSQFLPERHRQPSLFLPLRQGEKTSLFAQGFTGEPSDTDSTGHHKVRESEWKYGSSRSEPTSLFCEQRVWENQCILQDHDLISEAVTPPRPIPQFYCLYWTFRWNMFIKFTIWSRLRAKFIHSAQCRLQHSRGKQALSVFSRTTGNSWPHFKLFEQRESAQSCNLHFNHIYACIGFPQRRRRQQMHLVLTWWLPVQQ